MAILSILGKSKEHGIPQILDAILTPSTNVFDEMDQIENKFYRNFNQIRIDSWCRSQYFLFKWRKNPSDLELAANMYTCI